MSARPLSAWLADGRAEVERAIEAHLAAPPACPPVVLEAMRYSLRAGGKRLRPLLVLAAAEAVADALGRSRDEARQLAMPAACAVEMIHTYSLIHDDLPAMDDDTLRRGQPTLHVVHGEGLAILAGDGLQAQAFLVLAREGEDGAPEIAARTLRTVRVVAEAAGPAGMVGGQAVDLMAVGSAGGPIGPGELEDMHARKTGALIRASAEAGAIMAGAPPPMLEAVRRYATAIGLAFQIVDDILDVEGDASGLGKTAGKDAAAGKPTYPALYGLDGSKARAAECLDQAEAALAGAGLDESRLAGIARWIVERRS